MSGDRALPDDAELIGGRGHDAGPAARRSPRLRLHPARRPAAHDRRRNAARRRRAPPRGSQPSPRTSTGIRGRAGVDRQRAPSSGGNGEPGPGPSRRAARGRRSARPARSTSAGLEHDPGSLLQAVAWCHGRRRDRSRARRASPPRSGCAPPYARWPTSRRAALESGGGTRCGQLLAEFAMSRRKADRGQPRGRLRRCTGIHRRTRGHARRHPDVDRFPSHHRTHSHRWVSGRPLEFASRAAGSPSETSPQILNRGALEALADQLLAEHAGQPRTSALS